MSKHIIEKLEDIEEMKAEEVVAVIRKVVSYKGTARLSHIGFVYNIGLDRFSLIEPIASQERALGRVNYEWNGHTFVASIDDNQPFEKGSSEYLDYETKLLNLVINMGGRTE